MLETCDRDAGIIKAGIQNNYDEYAEGSCG